MLVVVAAAVVVVAVVVVVVVVVFVVAEKAQAEASSNLQVGFESKFWDLGRDMTASHWTCQGQSGFNPEDANVESGPQAADA